MRILITGATGLIGKALSEKCLREGVEVHYLTTHKKKLEHTSNYKGFYWNPQKQEIDTAAFEGVSVIINLAGASISKRWTNAYKKVILESRVESANLLYSTLTSMKHDVKHFISASGVGIYPASKTKLYTEENIEVGDTFLAEVVVAWEAAADQFKTLGMEVSKVRTGLVLASNEGALPQIAKPIKMGLGAVLGSGEQWQSWIHIEDIVEIYYHILQNELEGIYNGVAPNPVTHKKLTKHIALRLNKTIWLPKIPGFLLKIGLGEMATLVLDGQLVSSHKIEENRYIFRHAKIETALEDLL
ncbi:hypothetical protein ATE92_0312 [Ulvibacter sp. MAR_2010_11]|uniref:TIGR01777 family oxidoreductase n=1 Tax=Ulvibacter sp. MAR_2010_11 TaxID=1250229 RepID=UPI000C2BFC7F|nr:TIGR01777 family oxidoreductase [Ulvibacter sp. MAR_2010_11]PKA82187.1 hypothetical protein ATE92_0312 [Ulvibacter sp. MAR_2010_11]